MTYQRCIATNKTPSWGNDLRCCLLVRPGEVYCWQHGGPRQSPEERERSRLSAQRLSARYREAKIRRVYEDYNSSLDSKARQRKVARWMIGGGGTEAFEEFATMRHVTSTPPAHMRDN